MITSPRIKSITICTFAIISLLTASCRRAEQLPAKSSKEYNEIVRAFYVGLAALQVGHDIQADAKLAQVTTLVPAEPAAWANWGLLALRQRNFDIAAERLERARSLAPDNDQIYYLLGLLESSRGRSTEAIAALRKAVEINSKNLVATYKLADEIERQGGANHDAEYQQLIQKMLDAQPDNLAALLELGRVAAKRSDVDTLRKVVTKISERSSSWPDEVKQQVAAVQTASASDAKEAATRITFLRNVLVRVPEYRRDLSAIRPPPGEEAIPFTHFLRLESPTFAPAAPDELSFPTQKIEGLGDGKWDLIRGVSLSGKGAAAVIVANATEVRVANGATLSFPGGATSVAPAPDGILPIDFNYDFKNDLVLAGAGGVRFMKQNDPNSFSDVTAQTKLPADVVNQNYVGAWAADIEADGDLDIVLGSRQGAATVLRNNGDDSFLVIQPFNNVSGPTGFAWADLDADGDPDAALIDSSGKLHVFSNERQGQFHERALPTNIQAARAINVADINSDGVLDLLVVQTDRAIVRISDLDEGQRWETAQLGLANAPGFPDGECRLRIADLDNNGGLDFFVAPAPSTSIGSTSGAMIFLSTPEGSFAGTIREPHTSRTFDVADINSDGRLDLLALSAESQAIACVNQGKKNYHWQVVRPTASQASGDQRINPFGVGGEMEVRAGLSLQKQPINGPLVHFGLGEQTSADVVRVVWPNGTVQAEFEVKADLDVATEQRLKGSCPFLFAYNGKEMKFVKDAVPWGSAIGLRINTLGTASVEATEEWYKIAGDQLVPRDGYYDLRITAELWETYYYDHLSLMTVDHPPGTDIFVDERFVIPPVKLAITTVETPRRIVQAVDDTGLDVTAIVSKLDENYLDTFGRARYQGVTRDHYVEIDLGNDVPESGPLWLIANGWMHPTDSSINVAISQGQDVRAVPLSMEVPDGKGGWMIVQRNLGFPAGRKKICLFDLSGVFRPGTPRRLRLRTNLEIFWDSIEWAKGLQDAQLKTVRIDPSTADLHYRGFSVIDRPNNSSPEVPNYNRLASSKQIWRDLIGYYTRFGDVTELLRKVDDRYVIVNAGDEMTFRFPAQPPPPSGWVRDYILVGDGWIKDGDYNSTFSGTVSPLPYHAQRQYVENPGRLEDEWIYKQHPQDWVNYHTRYITPEVFRNALRIRQR